MIIEQDLSTYQSSFHEESAIVISLLVFEPISYHPPKYILTCWYHTTPVRQLHWSPHWDYRFWSVIINESIVLSISAWADVQVVASLQLAKLRWNVGDSQENLHWYKLNWNVGDSQEYLHWYKLNLNVGDSQEYLHWYHILYKCWTPKITLSYHLEAYNIKKTLLYLNCTFWHGRQHIIAREDISDCIPSGHRQLVHWTEKCILNRQNHNKNHMTANEASSNIIISFVKCTILYLFWYQYKFSLSIDNCRVLSLLRA